MKVKYIEYLHLTIVLVLLCHIWSLAESKQNSLQYTMKPGQIMLLGIFANSETYNKKADQCMHLRHKDVQYTQAMIYAIDYLINRNPSLLPGITVGWTLLDSCSSADITLANVISNIIMQGHHQTLSRNNDSLTETNVDTVIDLLQKTMSSPMLRENSIAGVIGAKLNAITLLTAALTSSIKIPQISYHSFDNSLNDRLIYRYFYRTSISHSVQMQNIFDIVHRFEWNWISFVVSETDDENMIRNSRFNAYHTHKICYSAIYRIYQNSTSNQLKNIVVKMKSDSRSQVVVVLGDEHAIFKFFKEAQNRNFSGKTFIGTYTWMHSSKIMTINADIIGGAIGISSDSEAISGFDKYLFQLNLCNNKVNPWFLKIWDEILSTRPNRPGKMIRPCHQLAHIIPQIRDPFYVLNTISILVMDAVLAFGHALHQGLGCNSTSCPPPSQWNLMKQSFNDILSKVKFTSISSKEFNFDENGNVGSTFDIINYQAIADQNEFGVSAIKIGSWNKKQGLRVDPKKIIWNGKRSWYDIPISRCSPGCPPGHYVYQDSNIKQDIMACCWRCLPCPMQTVSNMTNQLHCTECPTFTRPNRNKTKCLPLSLIYGHVLYRSPMIIIILTLVTVYCLCLLFIWITIILHRQTPIIKGSNFVLMNVLLFFFALSIPASLLHLLPPSYKVCNLRAFLMTTYVTGTYITIFCKVNQVFIIFKRSVRRKSKFAILTKNRNQLLIIFGVLVVVNGILLCLTLAHPFIVFKAVTKDNQIEFYCHGLNSYNDVNLLIWMAIIGIACTYLAYKTRSLPDNFNESKHIYLSSVMITVFGLCCFPVTIILSGQTADSIAALTALLLSGPPFLCLFVPKVYIIYFRPELNSKQSMLNSITNYSFGAKKDVANLKPSESINKSITKSKITPLG